MLSWLYKALATNTYYLSHVIQDGGLEREMAQNRPSISTRVCCRSMPVDSNVTRRIDEMLLLLGRRPKLPLSAANVFLVSCVSPRQVTVVI